MTLQIEWQFILCDILFWMTLHFEWHSIFSDFPFWVTFHFEWHSIFSDIPFWVTFHFEWYSILSDIPFWVTYWCLNLNDENWGGIGLSTSNLQVSESVSESQSSDLEMLAHLKSPDMFTDAKKNTYSSQSPVSALCIVITYYHSCLFLCLVP